jgi:phage FluMu gp28-like protein
VVSTPLGDTNRFARLALTDEGSSFEQHRVDLHTAIAAGFPEDVDALRADFPDPDMFAQEYECSFLASSMRLVSEETYDAACYARAEWTPDKGAAGFAGYDVARRAAGDYAASVEVLRTGAGLWVPPGGVEQRRGVPFDEQERWIGELLTRCRKVVMDSSGLGMHMHERMHARHGSRVEGVTFTGRSKAELAGALRDAFARRQLHVPIEDTHLRRAVLSIRREVTDAGNERYTAPRSRVAGHADAGWALAMAVWAGSAPEWSGRVLPRVRRTDSAAELIRAMGLGRCAKLYR